MCSLGYKARTALVKRLYQRDKTIHKLIETCNKLSTGLDPPRHRLTFDRLLDLANEDGFAELRVGGNVNEVWSNPEVRAAIRHRQLLICLKDELSLLAVEWRRVRHFIIDEESYWQSIIAQGHGSPTSPGDWDDLRLVEDRLVRCELELRLHKLQVDHAHILADSIASRRSSLTPLGCR